MFRGIHVVGNELNLLTLFIVSFALAVVIVLKWMLWRWMIGQIRNLREELPKAIVGELITRDEFKEIWERLMTTEAKLEHVESRLDAHLGTEDNGDDE